jgi:fructosamine-3-kinase
VIEDRVAEALDVTVRRARPLSGGDVAEAYRVELGGGACVFAKTKAGARPGFFETEAAGLEWLRETRTVPVPTVLAVEPGLLVLEWVDEGRPKASTEPDLGRSLARLHRCGARFFGRPDERPTGSLGLPNPATATWTEFYSTSRLLPLAREALDRRALDVESVARIESIAGRLGEFGAADEEPSRLHGDLWAGNRLVDVDGISWLIDPAAHGGHREFDLAMMRLFGGYGRDVFEAYEDTFPLADGWAARVPLHQLAPLVVHAIKFGGGYTDATRRALDQILPTR